MTTDLQSAKRPRTVAAGPYGHPFHPILVTIPIGAWVSSFVFDIASQTADEGGDFTRPATWLIGIGLVGAILAAVVGLHDLSLISRGTKAFATGVAHLTLNVVVVVVFAVSFALRQGADDGDVGAFPIVLSAVALLLLGASGWLGGKLAYHYGVRVADEATQAEGFAPRSPR